MSRVEIDNLIVGSGFVGAQLFRRLRGRNSSTLVVDLSCLSSQLDISSDNVALIDPDQISKTGRVGGGATVWGGALSWPSKTNWFSSGPPEWTGLSREIFELGNRSPDARKAKKWDDRSQLEKTAQSRNNPVSDAILLEGHRVPFLWQFSSWRMVRLMKKQAIEAKELIRCTPNPEGGGTITVMTDVGLKHFDCRRLFLAAGPIINALMVHLLSGQAEFTLGNHVSRRLGELKPEKGLRLGYFAKLRPFGRFITFGSVRPTGEESGTSGSSLIHSIRLVPNDATSLRACLSNPSINGVFSFLSAKFGRPVSVDVLQMIDSGPSLARLTISSNAKGTQSESRSVDGIKMKFQASMEDEVLKSANTQATAWIAKLKPGSTFIPAESSVLKDAAHYWGSLRNSLGPCQAEEALGSNPTVANNFQVRGLHSVYAVGASSFAVGAHGHPTLLASLTADVLCERLFLADRTAR